MRLNKKLEITKTNLGFYQLKYKPSDVELNKYYSQNYYQKNRGNYRKVYSSKELNYFNAKLDRLYSILNDLHKGRGNRILDIGCGEGYLLNYFLKKGWHPLGLDYTKSACVEKNPRCGKYVIEGDIYASIAELSRSNEKFEVINLTNVLEHVLDPLKMLEQIKKLTTKNTILIITVPNDFSSYHDYLIKNKIIKKPFWINYPDHISYFEKNSLDKLCQKSGWEMKDLVAEFPIDLFLVNSLSNYVDNPKNGPEAHKARIEMELYLSSMQSDDTINFYRAMAKIGLGRQITGFYKLKK